MNKGQTCADKRAHSTKKTKIYNIQRGHQQQRQDILT